MNDLPFQEFAKFHPFELKEVFSSGAALFGRHADLALVLQVYKRPYFVGKKAEIIDAVQAGKAEQWREGVRALLAAFSWEVRRDIVQALGSGRPCPFRAELLHEVASLLRDPEAPVRLEASRSVHLISGSGRSSQRHLDEVAALLEDPNARVRAGVCDVVASWGSQGDKHREAIAECLSDDDWDVREAAMRALSKMGDALHLHTDTAAARLNDPMAVVRATALGCLLQLGEAGACHADKVVQLATQDKFMFVRHAAVVTLDRMGKRELLDQALGYDPDEPESEESEGEAAPVEAESHE